MDKKQCFLAVLMSSPCLEVDTEDVECEGYLEEVVMAQVVRNVIVKGEW